MKKIIRKGLAFGLAVAILLGNFENVAYAENQDTTAKIAETTKKCCRRSIHYK